MEKSVVSLVHTVQAVLENCFVMSDINANIVMNRREHKTDHFFFQRKRTERPIKKNKLILFMQREKQQKKMNPLPYEESPPPYEEFPPPYSIELEHWKRPIKNGHIYYIVGPRNSGKTTLVRHLTQMREIVYVLPGNISTMDKYKNDQYCSQYREVSLHGFFRTMDLEIKLPFQCLIMEDSMVKKMQDLTKFVKFLKRAKECKTTVFIVSDDFSPQPIQVLVDFLFFIPSTALCLLFPPSKWLETFGSGYLDTIAGIKDIILIFQLHLGQAPFWLLKSQLAIPQVMFQSIE